MNIQNVGINQLAYNTQSTKISKAEEAKPVAQEAAKIEEKAAPAKQDTFEKTAANTSPTYSKKQLTKGQINQLMNDAQTRADSLTKMIQSMVVKQGQKSNLTLFGKNLYVSPEQSAEAQKSISDGGEFSVDAVAGRIMDMAKALSGGDSSKISKLRKAVEDGFKAAGVDFGGKLPDISNSTHDEVMRRFDDWQNEGQTKPGAKE